MTSGIATYLRLPTVQFRTAFVLPAFFNGMGMFLYRALWALVPAGEREETPGPAGATCASMRPQRVGRRIDTGMLSSAGALIVEVLWGMIPGDGADAGRGMPLFWPLLLAGVGMILIWLQADGDGLGTCSPGKRPGSHAKTITSVAWLVGGSILAGFGTSWLLASQFSWKGFQTVAVAAVALLVRVTAVMAPWLLRLWSWVRTAGQGQLRVETRADMATHLYGSVLQTLALIQRQADDPVPVASLARRQERELYTQLYGEEMRAQTPKDTLKQMRADVKERLPIAVEVICVNGTDLDEASTALVQTAGETVTNATKHSGASRVDVLAEAEPERVEVFVRDHDHGFNETEIHPDRRDVKESTKAQMKRYGRTARICTTPGEDTEVKSGLSR